MGQAALAGEAEETAEGAGLDEVRVAVAEAELPRRSGRLQGGAPEVDSDAASITPPESDDDRDDGVAGVSLSGSVSPDVSALSDSFSDSYTGSDYSGSDYTGSTSDYSSGEDEERKVVLDLDEIGSQRFNVLNELADDEAEIRASRSAALNLPAADELGAAEDPETAREEAKREYERGTMERVLRQLYPAELEQSDEFTALLTGHHRKEGSIDFLTRSNDHMDRFVRLTVSTAMRHVMLAQAGGGGRKRRKWRPLTLRALRFYVDRMPAAYRFQFSLRVERILNSNGLSLQMDQSFVLDPAEVARYFAPVYRPTVKQCNCTRPCHEMMDPNPLSENFCPCFSPNKRRCTASCACSGACELRRFEPAVETFLENFRDA